MLSDEIIVLLHVMMDDSSTVEMADDETIDDFIRGQGSN